MLNSTERELVALRSGLWRGPNAWGFRDGYRLSLAEAMANTEYG